MSFVIGRSFLVGVRGGDAEILAAIEAHRAREAVTVEQLIACVPLAADGVDDLVIVTVDGQGGDGASPDAGSLSDQGSSERRITVVARGDLSVEIYSIGGSRRFAARGARPFALAEFRAVTAFALLDVSDEAPGADELTTHGSGLPPGIVAGHGLAWASVDVGHEETVWRAPSSEQTVILPFGTRPAGELDDTVLTVPRSKQPADQDTVIYRGSRAVPPGRGVAPQPSAVNADTLTRSTQLYPVFQMGDQQPEALDGILYLGRNPRVPLQNSRVRTAARALPSSTQAVSGTHASLERSGTTIVVTDLGSRNGTVVYLPDIGPRRLRAWESVSLPPHSRVELGDDNVIYVLSPAPVFSALESSENS